MSLWKLIVTGFMICSLASLSTGALHLASIYGDHMVLQRGPHRAILTGTASREGDTVTAQIVGHGSPVTGQVHGGKWKVKLPAVTDHGPFVIHVSSSEGQVTLNDVLFGDVWLCSGQSNMGFDMGSVMNSAAELQKVGQFPTIRVFRTQHQKSDTPMDSVPVAEPWSVPNSQTVQHVSAVCWLFAEYLQPHLGYPIGILQATWEGTTIEAWSPLDAVRSCPTVHHTQAAQPCCPQTSLVIWNGMIRPLLSMTIFGALWYQGESNWDQTDIYACQMKQLVNHWRSEFSQQSLGETSATFPFGYVQLAPYGDTQDVGAWPAIRWAQTINHGYAPNPDQPNAFMAVAMDLPDFTSPMGPIHPRYKQDVAQRLMLGALNVAYGHSDVTFKGPFPTQFHVTGTGTQRTITIEYDNGRTSLNIRNKKGFDVCCGGANIHSCSERGTYWVDAPILSQQGSHVVISAAACNANKVLGLRYAWRTKAIQQFSAVCWLFAEYIQPHLKYPIGLVKASWGGTSIEAWSPPEAVNACPAVHHTTAESACCPLTPIVIWNGMIRPILSMTLFGVLWYQGEANKDQPNVYGCQIKQLMSQWRSQFNKGSEGETSIKFPFGYVQLAAWNDSPDVGPYPAIRWAQTGGYGYAPNPDQPNAFMAVAMDLPDFDSPDGAVHSRHKQDVAYRLMRGALNIAYGHSDVIFRGPFPTQFYMTGTGTQRTITIEYDNGRTSLNIRNTKGFDVCCGGTNAHSCTDQGTRWVEAPITSHQGAHVTISASACNADKVLGLRYAWRTTPCHFKQCAIYGVDTSLPAPQYITNTLPA